LTSNENGIIDRGSNLMPKESLMAILTRRKFLATAAVGAALGPWTVASPRACGQVLGANDAIRVGVVGLRGRGQLHMEMVSEVPGFRLAALCDVDAAVLGRAVERARAGKERAAVVAVQDVRQLLERKDIDAVTIATPNHWHALIGVWACQAGKDVYIEKPVSHNVWEGRQLVNAARKHHRMVETGTQARANPDVIEAVAWVRAGNLGKILYARGTCYKPRMSIGKFGKGEIPAGLDYNLWTGPAPLKPLARKNLHYDWHWIYDYGNGDLGNQGIHEMDIARWFLGYTTLSPHVMSVGGRLGYDDDGQTPNTQLVYHDYGGPPLLFEVRGLPRSKEHQRDGAWGRSMDATDALSPDFGIGVVVACEGGKCVVIDGGEMAVAVDRRGKVLRQFDTSHPRFGRGWSKGDHFNFASWQQAIRSRNPADLKAEILEGHLSSALCHTGMISHRIGQATPAGRIHGRIQSNRLAAERFGSMQEHLGRNGVDLTKTPLVLGPWLSMDPKTERFLDNDAANALLRRDYRKPFVVPEVVQS
jgi:predicted dehydrogenase